MSKVRFSVFTAGLLLASAIVSNGDAAADKDGLSSARSSSTAHHPDFSGVWTRGRTVDSPFRPPASGPGPVIALAAAKAQGGELYRQGDPNNAILQPWAADVVRKHMESERAGKMIHSAKETCWPMGLPYILQLNGRVQIVESGPEILFLYHEMMQQRVLRLNAEHPANLKPSWYGDSVAHWDGDTLVVDSVGIDKCSWIDSFGTPHTDKLHVVERYHLRNSNTLDVAISVDDSGAFTTPWSGVVTYRKDRGDGEYAEIVCAENNRDEVTGGVYAIPIAQRSDF